MKRINSKDVAKEAGVSQSTVSMILNNKKGVNFKKETIEKVMNAVEKLNYKPNILARNMKMNLANSIGIVISKYIDSFLIPNILEGIRKICIKNQNSITICNWEYKQQTPDYIEYYQQKRIDGLIYVATIDENIKQISNELNALKIPFVTIIAGYDIPQITTITYNLYKGAFESTKHLIEKKYKNILYISPENLNYGEMDRIKGYKEVISNFKLKQNIIYIKDYKNANIEIEKYLKQNKNIDSVIASHTYLAYNAMKSAVKLNKKIPKDFGIISCDHNSYAPYTQIPLSTADIPLIEMGEKSAEILFKKIKKEKHIKKFQCEPKLTIRESSSRE